VLFAVPWSGLFGLPVHLGARSWHPGSIAELAGRPQSAAV